MAPNAPLFVSRPFCQRENFRQSSVRDPTAKIPFSVESKNSEQYQDVCLSRLLLLPPVGLTAAAAAPQRGLCLPALQQRRPAAAATAAAPELPLSGPRSDKRKHCENAHFTYFPHADFIARSLRTSCLGKKLRNKKKLSSIVMAPLRVQNGGRRNGLLHSAGTPPPPPLRLSQKSRMNHFFPSPFIYYRQK